MTNIVRYGTGQSALGPFVVARSERGLAMVEFGTFSAADIQARFPEAEIAEDTVALQETTRTVARLIDDPGAGCDLALDLQGAAFEVAVWQALRGIPAGTTTTYGALASRLGTPRAAREIGEACAANRDRSVPSRGQSRTVPSPVIAGVRRKRALLEREGAGGLLRRSAIVAHGAV